MLDRTAIAAALREIAGLLQLRGENPFKVRAYETGARALEELTDEELARLVDERRLTEVPGLGEALAAKIGELFLTGRLAFLDGLRAEFPLAILELMRITNLGPRKVAALHQALGIAGLADLKAACEAGRVRGVRGFGEKTERAILESIRRLEANADQVLLVDARALGERLLAHTRASPAALRVELAGSVRRYQETVGDLDLVVGTLAADEVMDHVARHPLVAAVVSRGETKLTTRLSSGLPLELSAVPPGDFAAALHHATGAREHHAKLRALARARGLMVSERGVWRLEASGEAGERLPVHEEGDLYRHLGLPFVPPELREDAGELEAALAGTLPDDLVRREDLVGMVHCHTTYSDGRNTILEMARAADALGMRYLTITDHSPTAVYARGVELDRLKAQWDEIARVQERVKVRLLRGTESDILDSGALDYPDHVLEQMDVVIASIHSRMRLDEEQMTRRLLAAMRQPIFKIWGHPLARLVLRREPIACRIDEVLDAVAGSRAAVEINGDPYRLDLEPRLIRAARERGVRFVISTDAHAVEDLDNLHFGVGMARRGWVRRGEVLNALDVDAFRRAVRPAA